MKEFDKNYCHKTSKWMSENVSMECYEPTDTTQLLDGMVSDLNTLLENIKNMCYYENNGVKHQILYFWRLLWQI